MFHSESKTPQSSHRTRSVIIPLALFGLFVLIGAPEAAGQPQQGTPRNTGRAETTPAPPRPRPRPRPRPVVQSDTAKTPASVISNNLLELGYRFHDKEKWNAAEAAYNEAINAWPGNGAALLAKGYLYLDLRNLDPDKKIEKARAVQNKLRSVNSSFASTLLVEINAFQAQVAH